MPFNRPSLATLNARIQRDIESQLPGADAQLRRSVERVLGAVLAGASHGLHGHMDWIADQIIPDTAEHQYLARWARLFVGAPKPATPAKGNLTFTGTDGSDVPAATKVQRNDGTTFATDADATIAGGSTTTAATATENGAGGNTDAGSPLSLVSPVAGVASSVMVADDGLSGGADLESDDDYRARMLSAIQKPPSGGGPGDYANWALSVPSVTRAWEVPNYLGLGTVGVFFVMDDQAGSIIPGATTIAAVQAELDAKRPVTAIAYALAPIADPLALQIALTPNTSVIQAAVSSSIADIIRRRAKPEGTIYLSDILEAISIAPGVTRFTLLSPTADTIAALGHIIVPGAITWS